MPLSEVSPRKTQLRLLPTDSHPDSKAYPGASVQLHHQENVDEHADHGEEG